MLLTHWDATLNAGRGGPKLGGRDALDLWTPAGITRRTLRPDGANPWATDQFALVDRDPAATGPRYERYIGEGYSPLGGDAGQAAQFLGQRLGREVGLLDGHAAFNPDDPGRAIPHLATPQIAHLVRLTTPAGRDHLVTVLLPPGWDPAVIQPVLWTCSYDPTEHLLSAPSILDALRDAWAQGSRAIGLVWNGGGSHGTRGFHASLYDAGAQLLASLPGIGGDPGRIVLAGHSRGGIMALLIGSVLPHPPRIILASAPAVALGTQVSDYSPLTYPGMAEVADSDCADRTAWRGEEVPLSARLLLALVGTTSRAWADACSPMGRPPITAPLVLFSGTHDRIMPGPLVLEYAARQLQAGLPTRVEITPGLGHGIPVPLWRYAATALLHPDPPILVPSIVTCDLAGNEVAQGPPTWFELPGVLADTAGMSTLAVCGAGGRRYTVELVRIDRAAWDTDWTVSVVGGPEMVVAGSLPLGIGSAVVRASLQTERWTFDPYTLRPLGDQLYCWRCTVDGQAVTQWAVGRAPALESLSALPDWSGHQLASAIAPDGIGLGGWR